MDYIQDQLNSFLTNTTSTSYSTATMLSTLHSLYTYATTYLSQLLPLIPTTLPTSSADITSLLIFAVMLFSAYKILDYVRRLIMFWVFLAVKVVLLLAAVQAGLYVYTYGLEKTLRDAGWIWGMLEGFFQGTIEAGREGWNQNAIGGNVNENAGWGGQRGYGAGTRKVQQPRGRWT